jgi:hypothetical protein
LALREYQVRGLAEFPWVRRVMIAYKNQRDLAVGQVLSLFTITTIDVRVIAVGEDEDGPWVQLEEFRNDGGIFSIDEEYPCSSKQKTE